MCVRESGRERERGRERDPAVSGRRPVCVCVSVWENCACLFGRREQEREIINNNDNPNARIGK